MTFQKAYEELEHSRLPSQETRETAMDAIAFVEALHRVFKDNGMTTKDEPDVAELENLFDAINGELGAAVLFLSESTFARVPDMLRGLTKNIEKHNDGSVPVVVAKGFERLAKRIENARVHMQALSSVVQKTGDSA